MGTPLNIPLNPKVLFHAMVKHRGKAVICFVVTMAFVTLGLLLWPKTYISEASLFVKLGRPVLTLDPTVTTGQTVSIQESREVEINSILEVLQSRRIASKVVDRLSPAVVLGNTTKIPAEFTLTSASPRVEETVGLGELRKDMDYEKAIQEFSDTVKVWTPRRTTVVSLSYKAQTPELAQTILAAALDAYLEEHARVNRTSGSYEFFVEQEQAAGKKLQMLRNKLRDARNEAGLATIEGRQNALESMLAAIDTDLFNAETEAAATAAKIKALDESIAKLPERIVTSEVAGNANAAADGMKDRYYKLKERLDELNAKYTEKHPQVIALKRHLAEAERSLNEIPQDRVFSTTAKNPAREALELERLNAKTLLSSLTARVDELKQQYANAIDELRTLNTRETEFVQMERDVDLAQAQYREIAEKLEQARIDNEIDRQEISNVNIIQPASYAPKAVSPQRRTVFLMGLAAAFCGSIGVVVLAEMRTPSFNSAQDIERSLDMPVFGTVPRHAGADQFHLRN